MSKKIIGVLIFIIVLSVAGFVAMKQFTPTQTLPEVSATPLVIDSEKVTASADEISQLQQGGSSYRDPDGKYLFLYPSEYVLDTQNDGREIRIRKVGKTQKGQTELYDGVLLIFESVDTGGKNLETFVSERINTATKDGTLQVSNEKTTTTVNGFAGFSYSLKGFGESTTLVIQKNAQSNNALVITSLVTDPEGVGYQDEVNAILSTIKLLL